MSNTNLEKNNFNNIVNHNTASLQLPLDVGQSYRIVISSEKVSNFSLCLLPSLFGDKPKNAYFDTLVNEFCSF